MHKLTLQLLLAVCIIIAIMHFNTVTAQILLITRQPCVVGYCAPRSRSICTTNGKRCRVFRNECALRKHLCETGEKWRSTKQKSCGKAKPGGKAIKCKKRWFG